MTENLHGFELVSEQDVPEANSTARIYRHVKTGAELLSLLNDDENKVFAVTFATPPPDATGIAHILEHSVLCGSRKYPLKEPFVELIKGSMATFLNAMTFPDKTMYPVASQNLQDFYNLVDVYLDSVFFPRISPDILKQEGWHYELDEPDGDLTYKGVVYNEMKGAYSSADDNLQRISQTALYPDTAYGVDSGGDPEAIPDLTYDDFKHFHQTYYHPSNARIFFYGDDDPTERLRLLDEYLSQFDAIDVDSQIALQAQFDQPRETVASYDAGDSDDPRAMVTVSWLLPEPDNIELMLGFDILEHILLGTQAAPLKKALLDSGLGENTAGGGFNAGMRQMHFATGLRGVQVEDTEKVAPLVLEALGQLADNGIDPGQVEASLNTTEFQLREFNTGGYPRGLLMCIRSFNTWLYGGDPVAPLAFEAPLKAIKQKVAQGNYFEGLIREYLLENDHRSTVILTPDADLGKRRAEAERERLAKARSAMSEDDIQAVIAETAKLREMQNTPDSPEDLALIPSLTLDDIDRSVRTVPLAQSELDGEPLLYHDLATNGIFYLDLAFDLRALTAEQLPYLSMFNAALLQMGTEREDYVSLTQRIGQKTGGIGVSTLINAMQGQDDAATYNIVRSKATVQQVGDLLDILHDVMTRVDFNDRDRFKQIVLSRKAQAEASLIPAGHQVVVWRTGSHLTYTGWVREQVAGLTNLFFLRDLIQRIDTDWDAVRETLLDIRRRIFNRKALTVNVTLDQQDWNGVEDRVKGFVSSLPFADVQINKWDATIQPTSEGLSLPAQVNYVGKGANLYDLGYDYNGSVHVITNHINTSYLWNKVRVQGGAYGAGLSFDRDSGMARYFSYRDPNLLDTLRVYDETTAHLRDVEMNQDELTKNIIGVIGNMDSYKLPDAKGYSSMVRHLIGLSDEQRQQIRDQVLSTTLDDFRQFADALQALADNGVVVVLGSSDAINATKGKIETDLQVTKVL